jgi:subtilase family serine protease
MKRLASFLRRHLRLFAGALLILLASVLAFTLHSANPAHAQPPAARRASARVASAAPASASASAGAATRRRRTGSRSTPKHSFRALAPTTAPGRPGIPSPPPSAHALAQSLRQATGLSPAQVTTRAACPAVGPRQARCAARALVLRSNGALVRPRPGAGRAGGRVLSRARSAAPAQEMAAVAPPQAATPAYLQQAYDLTALSQSGGSGDTVAIVDAYDDPSAESDLTTYRSSYGLPPCTSADGCFRKVNQTGGTSSFPGADGAWQSEISLDLDAVSAICPNCHIVLVEANSDYIRDLGVAMQTAAAMGVSQISASWSGTSQLSGFTSSGVPTVAATGDNGYVGSGNAYPAAYPWVTAAGGTSLASATSNLRGFGEQAWSGAGSGCDTARGFSRPAYQPDIGCAGRAFGDLSADADPTTGLKIYTPSGWAVYGGTSLAAPLIAAYYAITGVSATTPQWAYTDSALLNDVVSGSNGGCSLAALCNAEAGYDGPTGVGSISGTVATGAPGVAGPAYASGSQNTYTQSVGSQGATIGGGIYRNGLDTTWWIEYGTSQTYGSQTAPVDIGAGSTPIAVTGSLTGLGAGTTYHYRIVAKNALGTTYGYDYTFTTAAASTPSAAFTFTPSAPTPNSSVSFSATGSVAGSGSLITSYS